MSNVHREILAAQLARLKSDEKEIKDGITSMEKQMTEMAAQIQRNQGALTYNGMMIKLANEAIEKIDSSLPVFTES